MNLQEKLESILVRHEELTQMLTQEQNREDFINLSKELSSIEDIVRVAKDYLNAQKQMKDNEEMMNDPEMDPELKQMANEEFYQLKEQLPKMEHEIKVLLFDF